MPTASSGTIPRSMKRLAVSLPLRGRLTYANVMATIAVFVSVGGGAYAVTGIPGSDGSINGCYKKKTGVLRVVKSGLRCRRGERRIAWSQKGVPGQAGAKGAAGDTGPKGDPGETGPAGAPNPNAETLDGLDSTAFVLGGGGAVMKSFRNAVGWANQTEDLASFPGFGLLRGFCEAAGENPYLHFQNLSGAALDSTYDNGGSNPTLNTIANGATRIEGPLAEPDAVTWQLGSPSETDKRVLTIIATAYDPPSVAECRFTGIAVFQTGAL